MYTELLNQQWKKTVRSKYFSQGWGVKILVGFLALYFGGSFLALGIFLPEILSESFPGAEVLTPVFVSFFLYYLLVDLVVRFFLQNLSVISIQHYLILPIRKSKIIHFLLRTSIYNFFNVLPLLFLIPFAIRVVSEEYGVFNAWMWFLTLYFLCLTNHFLAIYLKRMLAVKQVVFIILAVLIALLFTADFLGWLSFRAISEFLFAGIAGNPFSILISLLLMFTLYYLNFSFLKKYTHLDLWHKKEDANVNTSRFSFLESRGIVGTMVANELKLITRNKRTKSVLFITLLFALYGLVFYTNPQYKDGFGIFLFAGIFMTGIFMINYGQFLIAWESAYFDGILTRSYSMEDFFKAKFLLIAVSCIATYILSIPYVFFGIKALYINTAAFVYNIGFNSFVLLYASTYNKKRIDLSKSQAFNYQGTSAVQFIIVLPLLILPILIFQAFNVFDLHYTGLLVLAGIGLLSLLLRKYWFREIVKNFKEKKYRNAQGFREK